MLNRRPYTLIIGGLLILLLIMIALPVALFERKQHIPTQQSVQPTGAKPQDFPTQNNSPVQLTPVPMPSIKIEQYDLKASLPSIPSTAEIYTFKTNLNLDEIKKLGLKFGLTDIKQSKEDPRYYILTNTSNPDRRGFMTLDSNTGAYNFTSYGTTKPKLFSSTISPVLVAQLYLQEIEMNDGSIICKDTYEKTTTPGAVYVECHRDTARSNGPSILGYPAIINIPESQSIANLSVGSITAEAPEDKSIINSSNGSNGKVRSDDTNTLTLAFNKTNGRIISVQSNLRLIVSKTQLNSADFISPQEALEKVKANTVESMLTIPAGSGAIDWQRVYPNNQGTSTQASITDFVLTYLETPGGYAQRIMAPYYVVRGLAPLQSGYTVRFTQTVPATRKGLSFLNKGGSVAGASTYLVQNYDSNMVGSQKQGNFVVGQPSPTPTSPPNPTPGQANSSLKCIPPKGTFEPILQVPGLGEIKVVVTSAHMYFFKSATFPIKDLQEVKNYFYGLVEQQYVINVSKWLTQEPSFARYSLSSQEKAYQLYSSINQKIDRLRVKPEITPHPLMSYEAPRYPEWGDQYTKIAENVTTKLQQAAQGNSFTSLASQPNIFPDYTLDAFFFVVTGGNTTSMDSMCYISGGTPSLFAYNDSTEPITIKLGSPITYNYPLFNTTHGWTFTANSQGTLSFSPPHYLLPTTNYLYYEYDPTHISFTQPHEGWIVKTDELESWVKNTFAPQVGLNEQETKQMVNEVKHETYNIEHKTRNTSTELSASTEHVTYLKLSLANQVELNQKLPLTISRNLKMQRLHLLLSPATGNEHLSPPQLTRINHQNTVIELGARFNK